MGMYTTLTAIVKLKDEFVPVIEKMLDQRLNREYWKENNQWDNLGYDFLTNFSKVSRSDWVPFGDKNREEMERGIVDGVWSFDFQVKNYDSTIDVFLDDVLSQIIEEAYLIEYWYEEWLSPRMYVFANGKFEIQKDETGDWDDYV